MAKLLNSEKLIKVGQAIAEAEEAYTSDEFTKLDGNDFVLNEEGWKRVQKALQEMSSFAFEVGRFDLYWELRSLAENDNDVLEQQAFYVALGFFTRAHAQIQLLLLSDDSRADYEHEAYFGDEVFDAFPSASSEIQDCGSCFALGLNTAAVFHALRAIEVPLLLILQDFGIPKFDNWNSALNQVEGLIRSRENGTNIPDWDQKKDFYTDAINHLFAIKNAWRNYTMHLKLRFNKDETEEIIHAARAFMRKASKVVKE